MIKADVWIDCPYNPNIRHRLLAGNKAPYYNCLCLGINLGSDLKEGDEVIVEEVLGNEILVI